MELSIMSKHSQNELNNVISYFVLEAKTYTFSELNSGFINDTYLVSDSATPKYVLQRIIF